MKRKYDYEKKPSQSTASVQPKATYLHTRGFAPLQTDLDEDATFRPSGYTENFLEKIINQRGTESSDTPIQAKPMNRLKAFQSKRMAIQAKLSIGEPNDKYEQEADATASKVVQQINSTPQDKSVQKQDAMQSEDDELQMKPAISKIQRQEVMEDDELQMKPLSDSIQREEVVEEEEEDIQMKPMLQRREAVGGGDASEELESSIQQAKSSGQSLDLNLQAKMGRAMGADFSGVKVHTDSQSDRLNQSIQAKAFTTGKDVFFRQGAYEPSSKGGQELIAHELTHVLQQQGGGTKTVQRLITAEELSSPEKAGAPKQDKKIGIGKLSFTREMSGLYKSVLISLDQYHKYKPDIVSPNKSRRDGKASSIKQLLSNVKTACQNYFNEHSDVETDPRAKHISALYTYAAMEIQAVDAIAKNPSYQGMDWKMAIAPFMRMHELSSSGALDNSQFHGSGASLLDKIDGRIMSGAALEKAGIIRDTGEGDFFSRAKEEDEKIGEKEFISTGQGLPGMGTSLQYAVAASDDKNYNTARYSDDELKDELNKLFVIINNWDNNLNQVPEDDIMGARKNLGQFKNLYNRLEGERKIRENLPKNHARRRGETYTESTYGLLIEFASHDLDIRNPRPDITFRDDNESYRALGGERSIHNESVDLRDPGRLLRVYCPLNKMDTVREKVAKIVQHRKFEVIPFEALVNMPDAMKWTQIATAETLETQYENMRKMVLEAYSQGMNTGTPIDKNALTRAAKRIGLE